MEKRTLGRTGSQAVSSSSLESGSNKNKGLGPIFKPRPFCFGMSFVAHCGADSRQAVDPTPSG